ncbi:hypothetical protein CsSME_00039098 [Camellia sinensis var. sinensis]
MFLVNILVLICFCSLNIELRNLFTHVVIYCFFEYQSSLKLFLHPKKKENKELTIAFLVRSYLVIGTDAYHCCQFWNLCRVIL